MAYKTRMAGLVLAGGRSRRFGREKAVEILGCRTLLAWSLAAVESCCEVVAVSAPSGGGAADLADALGFAVLTDDPDHPPGPLAGLAAGLTWAVARGFDLLTTLPCDTPLVGGGEIAVLHAALGKAEAAYAITDDGPHGLCGVWRTSLAAGLSGRLAGGDHPAVRAYLEEIGAAPVWFTDAGVFRNVNTEEDLATLGRKLARRG